MVSRCGNKVLFAMLGEYGYGKRKRHLWRVDALKLRSNLGPESLSSQHKFIPYSMHSCQVHGIGRIVLKLLTQMRDVNPDDMRRGTNGVIPGRGEQLGHGNY